jgi:hypothetical protein
MGCLKGMEVKYGDHYRCVHEHNAVCRNEIENWHYELLKMDGKKPALYVLMMDGICVYVGYTSNLWQRMRDHIQQGKDWDSALYYFCPTKDEARRLELIFLRNCDNLPKYNRSRTH